MTFPRMNLLNRTTPNNATNTIIVAKILKITTFIFVGSLSYIAKADRNSLFLAKRIK